MARTTSTDDMAAALSPTWRDLVYFTDGRPNVYGVGKWPKNGPNLIRDLPPDMPVELINLQLRQLRVPLPVRKDRNGHDVLERRIVEPFGVFTVAAEYAARLLDRPHDNPDHMTNQIRGIVVAPPSGDCGGKQSFVVDAFGKDHKWETCCYIDCPRHPAPGKRTVDNVTYPAVRHSIWMAQHFLRTNGNPLAVKRYVEDFDPRYPVAALAFRHIDLLEQHKIERMGLPQASTRRRQTAVG